MIHAFAIEPQVAASWGRRDGFRFIHDKFGVGTPRVLLELPKFSKWKKAVYDAAAEIALSQEDMKRIEELFRLFGEHRHRRADAVYDGLLSWLENAEGEYARKPFAGILAAGNPRHHEAVLVGDQVGPGNLRWVCETGASPERTPEAMALVLAAMLKNCRELHLVDPHFGPENSRHRKVLEALTAILAGNGLFPAVRVHCSKKSELAFFEHEASAMASRLPSGVTVEFVRWRERPGSDQLHNRYVLTELGGVAIGIGLDAGGPGETDDFLLLSKPVYVRRWSQYARSDGTFEQVDLPKPVIGTRA